jgi:hypothetical protein
MQRANPVALTVMDERPRKTETPGLLTPARRAGLEALEREFSELLSVYRNQSAPSAAA